MKKFILYLMLSCCCVCSLNAQVEKKDPFLEHERYFEDEITKEDAQNDNRFLKEFFKMLLMLGLLVGALLLITWIFKRTMSTRMDQMNVTSAIKILERRSLTPKSVVYLVEVYGRSIVFAESPSGITALADITSQEREKHPSFQEVLDRTEESSSSG